MRDRLIEALGKGQADYLDVRYHVEEHSGFGYRKGQPDGVHIESSAGGVVRACIRGGWGVMAFDSLDRLEQAVLDACRCADLVGTGRTQLCELAPVVSESRADLKNDWRGVSVEDKLDLIRRYDRLILKQDDQIESSGVGYIDQFATVYFANSLGSYIVQETPQLALHWHAVARDGALVQRTHDSVASVDDFAALADVEHVIAETAQRAVDLLHAPKVEGGATTVMLDQVLGGVFVHEAFGHLSEADFICDNPQLGELMTLGRTIGSKDLTIIDDGSLAAGIGTVGFDAEGTPGQTTHLVKDGQIAGHLHSLETAAKMGEQPTGNARAVGRGNQPLVRMTNTYIDNGPATRDELFAGIDDGIYACGCFGGQTMLEMFTFSAAYGYRIEHGQIAGLVRDVVLTGNVFDTLHNIDGIADDLIMHKRGGGCGKGGQYPLPVGMGSPHLRIQDVVIGGEEGGR